MPEDTQNTPAEKADDASDLIGGLESLLEEEGAGLELPDEETAEDDVADLFDDVDDGEDAASPPGAPSTPRPESRRQGRRQERQTRRRRDLEDYRNLEAHLQASPLSVEVAEDRMTARLSRITADNSLENLLSALKRQGVRYGIDHDAMRGALTKAQRGQNQFEVTVARGTRPKVLRPTEVRHHLPRELVTPIQDSKTDFERLKLAIDGPYLEACKSWQGPVCLVAKDDLISEIVPAEIEAGTDVLGQPVAMDQDDEVHLEVGEHVTLSDDGLRATADLFGYAGLIGSAPTVICPIWMSSDHMEARFVYHAPRGTAAPVPSEEDIYNLLEMRWIEFGVMDRQVELLCTRLREGQALPTTVPIAQGTPEIQGEDAQIKYAFDPFELIKWNQLQSLLSLKAPEAIAHALREIYEGDDPEDRGIRFKAVRPGEVVVEKIPATTGVQGKDIQGEEVVSEEGKDVPLEVGEGLTPSEDELRATATMFGYVAMRWDIEVNIIPCLWIAPDRTAAYYLNLPQTLSPRFPSVAEMQAILEDMEITHGFSAERWAEIAADLEAGRRRDEYVILVAQGSPPEGGRDAAFEWAVQIDNDLPGRILEDGSIDFRDRNLTTVAKEGDLLGRLVPPKLGKPGRDIYGNELAPPAPLNIEVVTDTRIYAEPEDDGSMAFFCEVGGGISSDSRLKTLKGRRHMRINIGVYPISNIEGDIDYSTGNIDFNGDVVIGGSVQSQFSVKASGTVTIGGYIEAGACITAGKDILVQRGVVGTSTELVAGGDVMAKFIQEATVRAGGDIRVGSYLFNASVRARGQVLVPGMGEGKSRALVGGLVWGGRGISARSIGSPYNASTRLVVGVDPDQVNRADQIRANMHACAEKQRGLLKKLGVDHLDLTLIKQKLARCPSARQKQTMLVAVKRIAKLAELERNQQHELEQIAEEQRQQAVRTSVNVVADLFAGVEIRVGEQTEMVREDAERCRYRLVIDEDEQKITQETLKNTPRF